MIGGRLRKVCRSNNGVCAMAANTDVSKLLTSVELFFLRDQKIPVAEVFDGRRMSTKGRLMWAEESGQRFVIGSECEKGRHRLRTKNGHCIQCDTSKIARIRRFAETGFVYIAGSLKTKTIKIGSSKVPYERHGKNSYDGYGGATDWEPLFEVKFENMGRVESDAQSALNRHRVSAEYLKDRATIQKSRESFTCSFSDAKKAVMVTKEKQLTKEWTSPNVRLYEFAPTKAKEGANG